MTDDALRLVYHRSAVIECPHIDERVRVHVRNQSSRGIVSHYEEADQDCNTSGRETRRLSISIASREKRPML